MVTSTIYISYLSFYLPSCYVMHSPDWNQCQVPISAWTDKFMLFYEILFRQLHLQGGGLHADVNGDGVLDHVQVLNYIFLTTTLWLFWWFLRKQLCRDFVKVFFCVVWVGNVGAIFAKFGCYKLLPIFRCYVSFSACYRWKLGLSKLWKESILWFSLIPGQRSDSVVELWCV